MTDIARARDAIEALLKLKTINKDARYFAEAALSHLHGDIIFNFVCAGFDYQATVSGLTHIEVRRVGPTVTLDRRTPDSPFELPPGSGDTFDRPDYGPGPRSITITCPRCGRTSYNPEDVKQRYCGACHMYHDDMDTGPDA